MLIPQYNGYKWQILANVISAKEKVWAYNKMNESEQNDPETMLGKNISRYENLWKNKPSLLIHISLEKYLIFNMALTF